MRSEGLICSAPFLIFAGLPCFIGHCRKDQKQQNWNNIMRHKTELLAPAGSYDSLRAAVSAGADAVYLGGSRFGARAYADNFGERELCDAIGYAHLHGCDLYLTVNTLLKDSELEGLGAYLKPYYESGLDAVIVQDFGVLSYIRAYFPDLPVHASTQMTLLGPGGAAFLKELGAARIVTARELSLEEIRAIHASVDIEIESFVHGALCYCYSGQCLFSSMLGGRSGNRGRCAQPCRLPYEVRADGKVLNQREESYVLSPKDMCTLELLPEILKAGVCSLKIEGRMKRPEYTAGVVRIYRKYLDRYLEYKEEAYRVEKKDLEELKSLYNRGGFSTGYYQVRNGRELMSLSRPGHFEGRADKGKRRHSGRGQEIREKQSYEALLSRLKQEYVDKEKKEKIKGSFRISTEFPTEFLVSCKGIDIAVAGEPAQLPKNQPMSREAILRPLGKTGETPFVFEQLDLEGDAKVFLPIQQLNAMRREALAKLKQELWTRGSRKASAEMTVQEAFGNRFEKKECLPKILEQSEKSRQKANEYELHVQLERPETLAPVLDIPEVSRVSLSCGLLDFRKLGAYADACHKAGKAISLVFPAIFRASEQAYLQKQLSLLRDAGLDALVVKNLEELAFLREIDWQIPVILDHNLYTFNQWAHNFWKEQGILMDTLPLELNAQELCARGGRDSEMLVYGYVPLMVTAGCLHKTMKACKGHREIWKLVDRYKKEFPVVNECRWCYNVIYNCEPLSLLGNVREVEQIAPKSLRLSFVMEDELQIKQILEQYVETFFHGKAAEPLRGNFTRGHLKRGVE